MAQEEQPHILSSSNSGGGGSRNVKQKKIPQRGLGVAQLEKIRVEEQRKKAAIEAANAIGDAARSVSPAPVDFRYISPPVQMNGGGAEDAAGQSRLWSGDYSHRNNAAFRPPPVNLQAESSVATVSPVVGQRFFHFQQPASPVNVNVNPSSPSAVLMEPPSNQNMYCNSYATTTSYSWQEEYKMVGVKRPYPFSLESPPARSFPTHFDPSSVASRSRCDDDGAQMEPYIRYAIDGPSNPSPLPEHHPGEALREDGRRLNGDFLTLALPSSDSKHTYAIDSPGSQGPEENYRRRIEHLGESRSREEPFSFFPIRSDVDETNGNGEKGEAIDLNLKL